MGMLGNIRRISALVQDDMEEHLGDIAVLKMDAASMRPRAEHRPALEALADYAPELDLDALAELPAGSFGREVARFMTEHVLSPFVITEAIEPEMRRRNALGIRIAQTHDLLHVLAGFDTSWPGEMGVYAVQVAQRWSWLSPILGLTTWLVYPFLSGFRIGELRAAWRRGLDIGARAPFLLGERLEDRFAEPLSDVRASYGIPAP